MFIKSLLSIISNWKQPTYHSIDDWKSNLFGTSKYLYNEILFHHNKKWAIKLRKKEWILNAQSYMKEASLKRLYTISLPTICNFRKGKTAIIVKSLVILRTVGSGMGLKTWYTEGFSGVEILCPVQEVRGIPGWNAKCNKAI